MCLRAATGIIQRSTGTGFTGTTMLLIGYLCYHIIQHSEFENTVVPELGLI
jgi:hypothetical protein